ncbi:hypothetical protein ASG47_09370 [Devosia sp. Leaf420]|nr:hypothetical protein ASG47_09370 [Devosia sp. Leaf420]
MFGLLLRAIFARGYGKNKCAGCRNALHLCAQTALICLSRHHALNWCAGLAEFAHLMGNFVPISESVSMR